MKTRTSKEEGLLIKGVHVKNGIDYNFISVIDKCLVSMGTWFCEYAIR